MVDYKCVSSTDDGTDRLTVDIEGDYVEFTVNCEPFEDGSPCTLVILDRDSVAALHAQLGSWLSRQSADFPTVPGGTSARRTDGKIV